VKASWRLSGLLGLLGLLGLGGCAPRAMTITPDHPASPDAPIGRLAGPPPALRPGVVEAAPPARPEPSKQAPPASPHHGHH
jgi:hypothetical protein